MEKVSSLSLNILMEKLYVESAVNQMFEDISSFKDYPYLIIESDNKSIYKKIVDDLGLTRRLIFTFSAGVSAMSEPVTKLLEGSGVDLTHTQVVMLIIAAIASMMGESNNQQMVSKLKEEGIYNYLKDVISFITNVQELINSIFKKVLKSSHTLTEILGFTFIMVPVMKILNNLINDYGVTFNSMKELFIGLISGTITFGVKNIIDKIKKRLG
jgi:hypothetical protein